MEVGTLIHGRFTVEARAGTGGMGAVYRAHDRVTGQRVALKMMDAIAPLLVGRFARESRVLAELHHPGIVRYVAHGETTLDRRYLAMEWLEGRDLAARLKDGPLSVTDALKMVREIADAVGSAHRRGVIHRDLKPSNLFLVEDRVDRVKVLDFGVASSSRARTLALTRTGVAVGTPGYMAPEQARGEATIDARADVYALGCVLFEAIAGRAPFASEHVMAALVKSVLEGTPRLSEQVPRIPPEVDALVARLMAKEPADRPEDGAAVAAEIDHLEEAPRASTVRATPTITSAEQRPMSVVLVTDVVQSDVSGPDDATRDSRPTVGASQTAVHESHEAAAAVQSFGGRFETLFGGAVLATFEVQAAPTDQVVRAARCALQMRRLFPDAAIVLATGRGAKNLGVSGGEVVNRAVRLLEIVQAHADLGPTILVDPSSFGLLEGRFEIFCTLAGHVLIQERDTLHAERKILGRATPCVGRSREVGTLVAAFDECVEEPVACAVVLTGPAGVGKSRVRQELVRRLRERGDRFDLWIARGDAMSAGSPFAMVADLVRSAAGLAGSESDAPRRARLEQRVARSVEPDEVPRITQLLAEVIGAPFEEGVLPQVEAARADPLSMGDQMREAFEDFVAAQCAAQPLVIVLEDLQWGDGTAVQYVDTLLRNLASAPLLVIATARPEVEDVFGRPWAERGAQEIRVGPLTPRASKKLVAAVIDGLPEDRVEALVARAGGHPLLLEELLRAEHDDRRDGLPDTALALVQSRVMALDDEARRLLRAASVFGRTFFASGVTALLVGDRTDPVLESWLQALADQEWIVKRASSRFTGEAEYGFTQDVVREALYAMLTDQDRTLAHRLAGEWLARAGERDDVVLARHFELGAANERAVEHYARAAEQALDGNDFAATLAHGARAEALASSAQPLGRVRAQMAWAHFHLGAYDRAFELAERAVDLLEDGTVAWCRAAAVWAQAANKMSNLEVVQSLGEALLALAPSDDARLAYAAATSVTAVQLLIMGDRALAIRLCDRLDALARATAAPSPLLVGYVAHAQSARWAFTGDPGRALHELRAAGDAFEAAGDVRTLCALRKTQGWYAGECGALEEGERALAESIALAERLGLANLVAHAKYDASSPLIRLGSLDAARDHLTAALEAFEAQGDRRLTSGALASLSWVDRLSGDVARAIETARRAVDIAPSPPARITALSFLAEAELAAHRATNAWRVAEEGLALLGEVGVTEEGTASLRLVRAEALLAMGERERAVEALREARAALDERAARVGDDALRASFLSRIEENRRTVELASRWC